MSLLPYISDAVFLQTVKKVLDVGMDAIAKADRAFNRNVIDPFSMLFEMGSFGLDEASWLQNEKNRQAQKTLSNSIGLLHQGILGAVQGWQDLHTGGLVDVVNTEQEIIAEIKNKYNTVKGSDLIGIYQGLSDLIMPKGQQYRGYTAYYVEIIPKSPKRYNRCFTPSNRATGTLAPANEHIRQIDGASFYALATGHENALEMLYDKLPQAMQQCYPDMPKWDTVKAKRYFHQAFGG